RNLIVAVLVGSPEIHSARGPAHSKSFALRASVVERGSPLPLWMSRAGRTKSARSTLIVARDPNLPLPRCRAVGASDFSGVWSLEFGASLLRFSCAAD